MAPDWLAGCGGLTVAGLARGLFPGSCEGLLVGPVALHQPARRDEGLHSKAGSLELHPKAGLLKLHPKAGLLKLHPKAGLFELCR